MSFHSTTAEFRSMGIFLGEFGVVSYGFLEDDNGLLSFGVCGKNEINDGDDQDFLGESWGVAVGFLEDDNGLLFFGVGGKNEINDGDDQDFLGESWGVADGQEITSTGALLLTKTHGHFVMEKSNNSSSLLWPKGCRVSLTSVAEKLMSGSLNRPICLVNKNDLIDCAVLRTSCSETIVIGPEWSIRLDHFFIRPHRPFLTHYNLPVPVLFSFGNEPWDGELYFPSLHMTMEPILPIDFSACNLVAVNNEGCEVLLLNRENNVVVVYNAVENIVFSLPDLPRLEPGLNMMTYGCFSKATGNIGYEVLMVGFLFGEEFDDPWVRLYRHSPSQWWWRVEDGLLQNLVGIPVAPLMIGSRFMWVDSGFGSLCVVEDWRSDNVAILPVDVENFLGDYVFGIDDVGIPSFLVHRDENFFLYRVVVRMEEGYSVELMVDLGHKNFYCARSRAGFSVPSILSGVGLLDRIYVGGLLGDCCAIRYNGEPSNPQVLRYCHDHEEGNENQLDCECQSAFFLVPLFTVARLLPAVAHRLPPPT